jgi:Flp pilus assembly protein TadD
MNQSAKGKAMAAVPLSTPVPPAGEMPGGEDPLWLESESRPAGLNDRWLVPGVCIFLAAIVWVVFGQTLQNEFVSYDDGSYVYENPAVTHGLNLKGVEWAFTHTVVANWHPLTMMSHMLDCQWYGLNAGGHHLTNVLLHTASVIVLFLVLRRMTGALWRSALVAAVFAIHPLRVESVAWVAERKDVLSGLFFLLTLGAYVSYVRRAFSPGRYLLVVFLFALGLLSKPMVVTLPFVLLLLDYWPLNRFAVPATPAAAGGKGEGLKNHFIPRRLILEKIPLLALSGAACMTTMVTQKNIIVAVPVSLRMSNAVMSCVVYLRQMFCPTELAVLYPFPESGYPAWEIALAVVLLAAVSAGVFLRRQRQPYLLMGWLWYLGMLVPVIGLVQSGLRAHADRYTYLPQIGLYLALTWAAGSLGAGWRYRRWMFGGLSTIVLVALIFSARAQTFYWRNSESLWIHTIACTPDNCVAHNNLGNDLLKKGNVDEAIAEYQTALQIKPDYVEAHNSLGDALRLKGRVDEAIAQHQMALQTKPDNAKAYNDLGDVFLQQGRIDEAIANYQAALQIKPDNARAHYTLGNALLRKGRVDEAMSHYQTAVQIKPDIAEAHNNLGSILLQKGSLDEAIVHYQTAVQIKPDYADAHNNLGSALLKKGDVDEAIAQCQKSLEIKPDNAAACNNLGSALLQKGSMGEAITQFQKALEIKPDYPEALNNLAWLLAVCPQASLRNGDKAVELAQQVNRLTGDKNPFVLRTLAAACAEAGRFSEAVETAQRALQLAEAQSNTALADVIRSQAKFYQAGVPFHLSH